MGIAVIGRIVRGDLSRLFGLQVIQVERSARLVHDGRLVARPARVGKPDLLALLVGKGLGVGDRTGLGIEIGKVQGTPGTLRLNPFWYSKQILVWSTDKLKRSRYPPFAKSHLIFSKTGLPLGLGVIRK